LLAALGATSSAAIAGCSGDGGGDSSADENDTSDGDQGGSNDGGDAATTAPPDTSTTDRQADGTTDEGDTGGSSGLCPPTPMSYTSREWPDEDPYVTFEIPGTESVATEVNFSGLRISFADERTTITVFSAGRSGQGYSDSSVAQRAENRGSEVTDAYDAGSGVRVFTPEGQTETPGMADVILPSGSGSVRVTVTIGVRGSEQIVCREAVAAAHRRLIETMRAV